MIASSPALRMIYRFLCCIACCCLFTACSQQGQGTSSGFREFATKLAQFVGLAPATALYEASSSVNSISTHMTKEQEYYLGRAVAANILTRYQPEPDPALNEYVSRVGAAVLSTGDVPETFGGFHFQVLRSDEVNAMAAPGGFVFVTTGMLKLLPDEDTLAAVLAHEVSHVEKRHGVDSLSQAKMQDIVSSLGQLAGSLNCSEVVAQATLIFSGTVDEVVKNLLQAGYGRDQEFEADAGALTYLNAVNYNPVALDVLLEQLEKATPSDSAGGWFKTHPLAKDRRLAIEPLIAKLNPTSAELGRVVRSQRFQSAISGKLS
ncbi:MAG: M48 family metalloprotease [Oligoflexia bacterium]|nr:M48 family metalloprotease [Oligoflexia bacterium]